MSQYFRFFGFYLIMFFHFFFFGGKLGCSTSEIATTFCFFLLGSYQRKTAHMYMTLKYRWVQLKPTTPRWLHLCEADIGVSRSSPTRRRRRFTQPPMTTFARSGCRCSNQLPWRMGSQCANLCHGTIIEPETAAMAVEKLCQGS